MNILTQTLLRRLLGKDRGNKVIAFLDLVDGIDFEAVTQLLAAIKAKDAGKAGKALIALGAKDWAGRL